MNDTFFRPADSLKSRIAPTEVAPPRGYPLQGEVHDENAFALGGVAGHAGLFSTANDLAVFAQMMLNGGEYDGTRIIADSTVALFTKRAAGTRALGWDTCGGEGSCGDHLGEDAYGHTGFTGTSLWIDPDRDMFVILLTNRVHEPKAKRPAKVIADVRADLADAAALAVTDYADGPMLMPASFRADKAVDWNKPVRKPREAHARRKSANHYAARPRASTSKTSKRAHRQAPRRRRQAKPPRRSPAQARKRRARQELSAHGVLTAGTSRSVQRRGRQNR